MSSLPSWPYLICSVISFVTAIVCHEASHAFAAFKMGDPTAKGSGRLSFNPVRHIDPFGDIEVDYIEGSGELDLTGDDALTSVGEEE